MRGVLLGGRTTDASVLLALVWPISRSPKTQYVAFWRDKYKLKDQESAFAPYFDRERDDITPIDGSRPAKINYADYLPSRPQLSEAERKVVGRQLVKEMGGLRAILGDRQLVRDVTDDGMVEVPKLSLNISQLIHPLGERNILSQYQHDRDRPPWAGVLGEALQPGDQQVEKTGVLGEQILSSKTRLGAVDGISMLIDKGRLETGPPSGELDLGLGYNPVPINSHPGLECCDTNFRLFPTIKELETIRHQAL